MDRSRRLHEFWNWLPAFRAVAETEHLPTASEELRVSPSALSRTIRLLEDNLGRPLFTRIGRQIALNPDGESFLASVRNAMRLIDDGLAALTDQSISGQVRIFASPPFSRVFLVSALCALSHRHPALVPSLRTAREGQVGALLLRGELDVAFVADAIDESERLEVHHLGELEHGVYCAPDHPLASASAVELKTLETSAFVAPWPRDHAARYEGWPPERARRVKLHVPDLEDAIQAAASAELLVVLPTRRSDQSGFPLVRVACSLETKTRVFALRRPRNPGHDKAQEVIDAATAEFRRTDDASGVEAPRTFGEP